MMLVILVLAEANFLTTSELGKIALNNCDVQLLKCNDCWCLTVWYAQVSSAVAAL